jgi:hypothetical protein
MRDNNPDVADFMALDSTKQFLASVVFNFMLFGGRFSAVLYDGNGVTRDISVELRDDLFERWLMDGAKSIRVLRGKNPPFPIRMDEVIFAVEPPLGLIDIYVPTERLDPIFEGFWSEMRAFGAGILKLRNGR